MAGYSTTPLIKKLGIKSDITACILNPPKDYFDLISPLPDGVTIMKRLAAGLDFIHCFEIDYKNFQENFRKAKAVLNKDGLIWISWPKKSAKVATDLDENKIRDFGLSEGLVDVKVCAVDETWSGLKFVFRVKDR
jgi:hypothetical protein